MVSTTNSDKYTRLVINKVSKNMLKAMLQFKKYKYMIKSKSYLQ